MPWTIELLEFEIHMTQPPNSLQQPRRKRSIEGGRDGSLWRARQGIGMCSACLAAE
jgi:hypothetical protein